MFDFGIGATELMLIAVVALIVVGPKDLPRLMRTVGHMVAKVKNLAREFQGHLDEAMRETGLDEVKGSVGQVKEYTVADLDAEFEQLEKEFRETALPQSADAHESDHLAEDGGNDGGDDDGMKEGGESAAPEVLSLDAETAETEKGAEKRTPRDEAGAETESLSGEERGERAS